MSPSTSRPYTTLRTDRQCRPTSAIGFDTIHSALDTLIAEGWLLSSVTTDDDDTLIWMFFKD